MPSLQILRRLNASPADLVDYLETHGYLFEIEGDHAGQYVENDRPWDTEIAQDLVAHTRDFAVADEEGVIHGTFRSLDRAESALKGATWKFAVDVEVDAEEPEQPKARAAR